MTRARAKAVTGPTKLFFKPDQKRKPGTTPRPVAPPKPSRAGGKPVSIPTTPGSKQVTRFFQPIIDRNQPVKIPVAYIAKHMKRERRTDALLEGREGKHWPVMIEAGRFFGEGWDQFARDHDLEEGYLLIFSHKGDMLFEVTVIDRTSLKREYPPFDAQDTIMIEEEELPPQPQKVPNTIFSEGETSSGCSKDKQDYPSVTMILGSSYVSGRALNFPTSFVNINQLRERLKAEVILIDPSGTKFGGFKFSCNVSSHNRLCLRKGWNDYSTTHGLREGVYVIFELVENTNEVVKFQLYHVQPKRLQSKEYARKLKQTELGHRNFIAVLKKYNLSQGLNIPKSFAERNGLAYKGGRVIIEDEEGRLYEASITDDTRPASLGRGWVKVVKANGFKEGDVLMFHLIDNGIKPRLKVTVVSKS